MQEYKTQGTCSYKILFDIDNQKVSNVVFKGGCPGSLIGISKLVEGMEIEEVIKILKGIKCGNKNTSCPDQLAIALEKYL